MEDRDLEAAHFGKTRVNVERAVELVQRTCVSAIFSLHFDDSGPRSHLLVIATQPVDASLLLERVLLDDNVRRAPRWLVRRGAGAAVGGLLLPAKPTAATEEDGRLVVKDVLARLGVGRRDAVLDDGRVALVYDLNELGLGNQAARGRHRVLADFEVLFAVQQHHGAEVGHERVEGERGLGVKGWDDAVGREDLEVFGSLTASLEESETKK